MLLYKNIMEENDDKIKRSVSYALASHILQSQRNEILLMPTEMEEQFRKTYIDIINKPTWKEELIDIGKMIKQ